MQVLSREEVEKKVTAYLEKSQALADYSQQPITAEQLQAEMERMASHTRQPDVLRELFAALGNDPFVIAECLARPVVAERLLAERKGGSSSPLLDAESNREANKNSWPSALANIARRAVDPPHAVYKLPQIAPQGCADDTWTPTSTVNAPDVRAFHTAVWTGSEMIVWGGLNSNALNTGAKYDPAEDVWTSTSTVNAPTGRVGHSAVWTGKEMIVWAGEGTGSPRQVNTGGRYNPITDSWAATNTANAPVPREQHSAVWTGSEMIVWGGISDPFVWFNTGGRYDPNTDSWTATSTTNAPGARWAHTVEWTGSEMIVWGGTDSMNYLNTGGRYDPTSDSWTPTGLMNAPLGRYAFTGVWSGNEMIVWGGVDSTFNDSNTGGRYNPNTDSWLATGLNNAPSPRDSQTAVWTGSEMIIWGGEFCCPGIDFNTGGRYNAGTDSWTATSTGNAPLGRFHHTAVWAGNEMIVWGGYNGQGSIYLRTGGRYCAQSEATPTPTPTATATPTPTPTPSATPTGTATATATPTPTATPRPTPTPRLNPTPRSRPTPPPRP